MNWTRGHTIGHGSSATVSVAMSRRSGEIFAVKSTELSRFEFLQKEHSILSTLNSPHVVGYKGCDVTRENNKVMFNLMMEYMPDGTLTDEIRRHGGRINEQLIRHHTKQIVQGLDYLHSNDIVHCDIKGDNILLGKSGTKIADFGCARQVKLDGCIDVRSTTPIGGTPMFMAPEVAHGEEQGFPADVWALGCTIIEMATGGSPWTNVKDPVSLFYHIAFSNQTPEIPQFLSSQARDCLSKCLRRNPTQRWSAEQLLKHPFLQASNQDFIACTPTSILDQGIWNSVEESETIDDSIQTINSMVSPLQRVRELVMQSRKPDWELAESWITVKKNNEDNKCDDGKLVSGTTACCTSCDCEDNIFCFSNFCSVQQGAVISSLNFDTHNSSSANKIMC